MSPIFVTVLILNWNGKHLLNDCLISLQRQDFHDFEVVLVDNGSTDASVDYVRSNFPEIHLVELGRNLGFASGNNRGIPRASGTHILFLNNDTEAHPAMLSALNKAIQSDSTEVGAWAVKMLRWNPRDVIDNCGCGYSAFGAAFPIGSGQRDTDQFPPAWIFGASGGAGCYRRSVLDDIGYFDDDFFYSNEDVDLNFRMQLSGYKCRYVPEAIVYHRGSATSGSTSDATLYHIHRNKEWVFFKNMPSALLWKYLPLHSAYSLAWLGYWLLNRKAGVVIRAYRDAFRAWPNVIRKRRHIQMRRRRDARYIDSLIDWRHALFPPSSKRCCATLTSLFRRNPR